MAEDKPVEIHEKDYGLAEKIGGRGAISKLFTKERIAKGQQVIEEFKSDYFSEISMYRQPLQAAVAGNGDTEELLGVCKAIKNQSEALGFDFLMRASHSLYDYLHGKTERNPPNDIVVAKHAEALLVALENKMNDEGGKVEEELLQSLLHLKAHL
jgi:hypothetical protein